MEKFGPLGGHANYATFEMLPWSDYDDLLQKWPSRVTPVSNFQKVNFTCCGIKVEEKSGNLIVVEVLLRKESPDSYSVNEKVF